MSYNIQQFFFNGYGVDIENAINSSLLWQYNKALRLTSLVNQKATWYEDNYNLFWLNWYSDVFNLYTANIFGLAVWTIILNLPLRVNQQSDPEGKPIWGFGPDVGSWVAGYALNFENANFSNITTPQLNTEEIRFLLQLRYFQLQACGAVPEINQFLVTIVGGLSDTGTIYVVDNLNMTITYFFTFTPRPALITALEFLDVLPRPSAVKVILNLP